MPQPFNNAVITRKGLQLLTRAQGGENKIEFTRIETGSGVYSEDEKQPEILQERNGLKKQENSYALSSVDIHSDTSVKITALITNQDPVTLQALVSEGYHINEMGLYAKPKGALEDEEILYSIAVTAGEKGDYMPSYNGHNPAQILQDYFATVSNSSEVTIQGNNGAIALADDLNEFKQKTNETLLKKLNTDGDTSDTTVEFKAAETRENITSGEKQSSLFGKIAKFFSDIKDAAFYSVINNLLATKSGVGVLDAYQGKLLKDMYDELNTTVTELNGNLGKQMLYTSVLQKAINLSSGFYVYTLGGASYTGNDLPVSTYAYGSCAILKRSNTSICIVLFGETSTTPLTINHYVGDSAWIGWETYVRTKDLVNINDALSVLAYDLKLCNSEKSVWGYYIAYIPVSEVSGKHGRKVLFKFSGAIGIGKISASNVYQLVGIEWLTSKQLPYSAAAVATEEGCVPNSATSEGLVIMRSSVNASPKAYYHIL